MIFLLLFALPVFASHSDQEQEFNPKNTTTVIVDTTSESVMPASIPDDAYKCWWAALYTKGKATWIKTKNGTHRVYLKICDDDPH